MRVRNLIQEALFTMAGKNRIKAKYVVIAQAAALVAALMIGLPAGHAAEIGQIKTLKGTVYLVRHNEQHAAKLGELLEPADALVTAANGSVGITLIDNSRISAGPNSRIELSQFRFDPTTQDGDFVLGMDRGTAVVVSGQIAKRSPEAMKVKTPTSILGVRGTTFAVKVEN